MDFYNTFTIVIVLAAIMAYLNQRLLKLPNNIGVMIIAVVVSIALTLTSKSFPEVFKGTRALIDSVDFSNVVIGAILNFLLFAGTIRIRIADLKQQQLPVLLFSTLSVIISTFIIGALVYLLTQVLQLNISFLQCLLFGSLISPTDPVSVLSVLKDAGLSKSLETKIAGESLFNDGVALVIFFSILHAIHNPEESIRMNDILTVFAREALGGLALGMLLGFIAIKALKSINDHNIEVMITLAVVMGGYSLARYIHLSGPLTTVAAGIFIGNYGKQYAMSDVSKDYLDKFWELIEEILNVILFVLIGFELLVIKHNEHYWLIGVATVLIVLVARFISLWLPSFIINLKEKMNHQVVLFLTWGGLRGGISIALALTLSRGLHKDLFLFATYCVVLFSVVVQGLSIEKIINYYKKRKDTKQELVSELIDDGAA